MNIGRYFGLGSASLILIFSVLCFSIFSLLSYSSSQKDMTLTEKYKTSVESYYSADRRAVETTASLLKSLKGGITPLEINKIAINNNENNTFSFSCPIDNSRSLAVVLQLAGDKFKILSWHEIGTNNWNPNEDLAVWSGEELSQ